MHNIRVLTSAGVDELESEMTKIGAEWPGVARMARKATHFVVKVHSLKTPAILILKEEMLANGGDCAIHRDAITNRVEQSDCILMGTEKTFSQVLTDLRVQPFGLPKLATEIKAVIDDFKRSKPLVPAADKLPESLRGFYSTLQERTLVMGILNVTPDSFSDGGLYADFDAAVEHGVKMVEDGADVIDVGGESTRPNAPPVSIEDELDRVIPVIQELSSRISVPISIDTFKARIARAALDEGAVIVNDITGLADAEMRELVAARMSPTVLMHMQGTPQTMQENPTYDDVVSDIMAFLRERVEAAVEAGLPAEYLIIDPGIGFGKTMEHNLEILRKLADFRSLGLPILIGASRKAFIGKILEDLPAEERVFGTGATVALSIANGANIVRVHDVKEMVQVARVADKVVKRI